MIGLMQNHLSTEYAVLGDILCARLQVEKLNDLVSS